MMGGGFNISNQQLNNYQPTAYLFSSKRKIFQENTDPENSKKQILQLYIWIGCFLVAFN